MFWNRKGRRVGHDVQPVGNRPLQLDHQRQRIDSMYANRVGIARLARMIGARAAYFVQRSGRAQAGGAVQRARRAFIGARCRVEQPLPRELEIAGGDGMAVAPAHVVAQMEDVGAPAVEHLPTAGNVGDSFELLAFLQQPGKERHLVVEGRVRVPVLGFDAPHAAVRLDGRRQIARRDLPPACAGSRARSSARRLGWPADSPTRPRAPTPAASTPVRSLRRPLAAVTRPAPAGTSRPLPGWHRPAAPGRPPAADSRLRAAGCRSVPSDRPGCSAAPRCARGRGAPALRPPAGGTRGAGA